jgi:hypothetical protein
MQNEYPQKAKDNNLMKRNSHILAYLLESLNKSIFGNPEAIWPCSLYIWVL